MDLLAPAGSLPALKAAVDNGADAIYFGFADDTNARHFAGLNFNEQRAREGIAYARARGTRIYTAINTYPQSRGWARWTGSVDRAAALGVDALIVADIGLLDYAAERYPELPLHLSVQASATSQEALRFYQQNFGIRRAVLPRVLSLPQVQALADGAPVELEVFGFGSLCVMVEGRCSLSSYATGESPNTCGVCSPAKAVRWENDGDELRSRLNGVLIDRFGPGESAGYPTLCKGRFKVGGHTFHALEEPTSLNTMDILPELQAAGVKAIKLEGRQRSPAYIGQVVGVWREALSACAEAPERYRPHSRWTSMLASASEGSQTTLGAYHRPWQ